MIWVAPAADCGPATVLAPRPSSPSRCLSIWLCTANISFARYSFESLALNEFAYEEDDDGVGGTYWLEYWGFKHETKARTFGWFVVSVAGFHVVAWAAMKYVSYERR